MDEAEEMEQSSPRIELLAKQMAGSKANVAKWGLNIVVLLFAVLITIVILISLGIGTDIVALLAVLGLAAVWFIGQRQGRRLYQRFYADELSGLQQKPSEKAAAMAEQLTPREIQILNFVAQGYANKQIAVELGISKNTVKNFVSNVLAKLNANDRTEAAVIAIKHGLVSLR